MRDDDRKMILRRRAFFVTSALAALGGCARGSTANQPGNTVEVPVATEEPVGSDGGAEPPRQPNPNTRAGMPPTDIPDGVTPRTHAYYETLYDSMAKLHSHLDTIEASIGRCKGLDRECEKNELPQIANAMNGIDDALERIQSCGGKSPEARLYLVRETAHLQFFGQRRGSMEEKVKQLLAPGGADAEMRLRGLREAGAVPRPCLEYACPDW